MGEHGRQVQKDVQNEGSQVGRGGNQNPQGPGVLDEVHGEADASVQKTEDVDHTGSALGKGGPVQGVPHYLLNTGLVQKTFSWEKGGFDEEGGSGGGEAEFNAAVGGSREGFEGGEGFGVEVGSDEILRTGNSNCGEEGRIADTSFS